MNLELMTKDKTYSTQTFDVTFGVVDDLIKAINPEEVDFSDKLALAKAILCAWGQIEPLLMDLFEGVTTEELRTVKMSNLVKIAQDIFAYLNGELKGVAEKVKN